MSDPETMYDDHAPALPAMGQVPTTGRGSLPFAALDGEPLVLLASHALEDAGVELVDFNVELAAVKDHDRALVLHDPLCPLTPAAFLREAIELAVFEDVVVVGVQPVTDTIKTAREGVVGETVDREGLWTLTSPVVLPASAVAGLSDWPDASDFPALVVSLVERREVRFLPSPALGRRVDDESSVVLLEALASTKRLPR
ncbi:MAG TPA: 2-C-methyl-D-erythritol 4-phosphate cytidylyltransferase [Nocardioidaceae bacterium]|nr:2-C-methyl-D-erythritol 4-phosphate cytidylyltransferase [Nocardioidaceae bacterium]